MGLKKIIFLIAMVLQAQIFACTIFNAEGVNGEVLVGNNCDCRVLSYAQYHVEPGDDSSYGAIFFGSENPQSAINECGLFFGNATFRSWSEEEYLPEDMLYEGDFRRKLMQECATVEEAIELCLKYSASMFIDHHMLISDSHGKSAIIEWDGTKLNVIRKSEGYQVATNFVISHIENEDEVSCRRYLTATELLKTEEMSADSARGVLEATRQANALFSLVGDLSNKVVYLYYSRQNYDDVVVIDVMKELQKGKQIVNISSLYCQ